MMQRNRIDIFYISMRSNYVAVLVRIIPQTVFISVVIPKLYTALDRFILFELLGANKVELVPWATSSEDAESLLC